MATPMNRSDSVPTTKAARLDPERRHDAVLLFDVTNGNPNGDPDAGNQPRINPLDLRGLVTDVAIKRKVRNFIQASRPADNDNDDASAKNARYKVYVEEHAALNSRHRRAYTVLDLPSRKTNSSQQLEAQHWMCENFFDVRMFGAVMSTGDYNCGQVKGPMQIGFASSIDPVFALEQAITRVAVTREDELEKLQSGEGGKDREMGRKPIVPYGLYRVHAYYSPYYGRRTNVSVEDLELFWQALVMMWDLDRSAARADMACRGLYVFSHENPLGNAPAHKLLELVRVEKVTDAEVPASFGDYKVIAPDQKSMPEGVTFSGDLA
jgi:CRISPR-associated protein Csd2